MSRIGIYFAPNSHRSKIVANAMTAGLSKLGVQHDTMSSLRIRALPDHEVAIFYGLSQGLRRVFDQFQRQGRKAIYVDLGYWGRRKRTRYDGYHKMALNSRHPTAYFQNYAHPAARFGRFGVHMEEWRKAGRHILLVGMSAKAAAAEGFQANQWERDTIARLREFTDRPILYRPKPNWREAKPLPGSEYGIAQTLEESFRNCHAVVTHHSNVAVDALVAGIPCICPHGVASVISGHNLSEIESPPTMPGRLQWAADVAWTQWSIEEMTDGLAYRYLVDEGLI